MLKTLGAQVKEFKKPPLPFLLFMILEVIMEMIIPLMMASIIDDGVEKGDLHHIYVVECSWWQQQPLVCLPVSWAENMEQKRCQLQEICVRPCLKTFRNIHFRISTNSAPQVCHPPDDRRHLTCRMPIR